MYVYKVEVIKLIFQLRIPEIERFKVDKTSWVQMYVLYLEFVVSAQSSTEESSVGTNTTICDFCKVKDTDIHDYKNI